MMKTTAMTTTTTATAAPGLERLTEQEREVFQLLVCDKTPKEAAELLEISPKTVAVHKFHVLQKLGVRTVQGLVRRAVELGVIEAGSGGTVNGER